MTLESNGELIAAYSYDALGRRIEKVVTNSGDLNGTTYFDLDGDREIEEHNGAGVLTQQYVYGIGPNETLVIDRNLTGGPIATGPGNQRLFFYQNPLGSVMALTDSSADILEAYQYDAYGRQTVLDPGPSGVVVFGSGDVVTSGGTSNLGNPFLFAGMRLDPETGLYYDRERYLDAVQGRFLTRDMLEDFEGMNLYEYSMSDPTDQTDPSGEMSILPGVEKLIELLEKLATLELVAKAEDNFRTLFGIPESIPIEFKFKYTNSECHKPIFSKRCICRCTMDITMSYCKITKKDGKYILAGASDTTKSDTSEGSACKPGDHATCKTNCEARISDLTKKAQPQFTTCKDLVNFLNNPKKE